MLIAVQTVSKFSRMLVLTLAERSYLFLQPLNYGAFLFDTDDLSTLRGGSMTLHRAPDALLGWISNQGLKVDVLKNAASELFALLEMEASPGDTDDGLSPEPFAPPEGVDDDLWRKAFNALRNNSDVKSAAQRGTLKDNLLRDLAERRIKKNKLANDFALSLARQVKAAVAANRPLSTTEMGKLATEARAFLAAERDGFPFDVMSFGLEVAGYDPSLDQASVRNRMESRIRYRQLQNWTVPLVPPSRAIDAQNAVCRLTGLLPAAPGERKGNDRVSASVARRRVIGRDSKHGFYLRELRRAKRLHSDLSNKRSDAFEPVRDRIGDVGVIDKAINCLEDDSFGGFVNDFHDLVKSPPEHVAAALRFGIAVIYMDGNGFGAASKAVIAQHPKDGMQAMSTWMELRKAVLLSRIVLWIGERPEQRMTDGKAAFETLMWGGDEFEFVMPAWCGWDFACMLSNRLSDWVNPFTRKELSFGIGLAFGKYKTPIRALREAASALSSEAKQVSRTRSLFQVLAYESVDRVSMSPQAFRTERFGADVGAEALVLSPHAILNARALAAKVASVIGYSGLMEWAIEHRAELAQLAHPDDPESSSVIAEMRQDLTERLDRVGRTQSAFPVILEASPSVQNGEVVALLQGLALRDYIRGPEEVLL